MLSAWLKQLQRTIAGKRTPKAASSRPQRPGRQLFMETLEDRRLLAVRVWDGGAGPNWSDADNWVGDVAPLAGDDLVFPTGAANLANTNNFAVGTRFNTIQIQGSGYTIGGESIELYGGLTANNAAGSNTFGLDVRLINAVSLFSANAGTTLYVTGQIDTANLVGTSNIQGTSALTLDGAGALVISGKITGSGSISKYGAGTATVSGANDYQGITDVRQGFLIAASNTALGSSTLGDTQVQAGASLGLQGGVSIAEPLAIREGGIGFGTAVSTEGVGALRNLSGTNTWSGNIDLAGGNNLIGADSGSTLIISGVISDALSESQRLIKAGSGTLRFTGSQANVYRGDTHVLEGTLELGKDAGVNAFWGNLVIGNDIEASGTTTVKLLNDNQIPHLNYFNVGLLTLTVRSTGVLDFGGKTDTVGNIVLVSGRTDSANIDLNGGTLVLGGASIVQNTYQGSSGVSPAAAIEDGTLDLGSFFSGTGGGLTKTIQSDDSQLSNVATDFEISANIIGTTDLSVTKTGGGALRLSGDNSGLHGPFIMNGGIIEVAGTATFGDGLLSLQNSGNVLKAVGAQTITNAVGLDGNVTFIGQDSLTFTGVATLSGGRTLFVMDPEQTVTFSGSIGEGIFGSQSLSKSGPGTLALAAANTYSGTTTVNSDGGTLVLSGNGTLLNTSAVTINQAGRLKLANAAGSNLERLNDLTPINLSGGTLEFQAAAGETSTETLGTLTLAGNQSQSIVSDANGGTARLTFQQLAAMPAGASLNLVARGADLGSASNKIQFIYNPPGMAGAIVPNATVTGLTGRLDFATIRGTGVGFEVVALPATAYMADLNTAGTADNVRLAAGTHTLTSSRTINSLVLEDGAVLNLAGYTLSVQGMNGLAGLILGHNAVLGNDTGADKGTLNLAHQAIITVREGATAAVHSTVMGAATAITKAGRGRLILSGDNQYGGVTNVNEGILNIRHSNALGVQGTNASGSQTTVRQRATLEVENPTGLPADDVKVLLEALSLTGVGFGELLPNGNHARFEDTLGALRNLAGNNTWAGTVTLGADAVYLPGLRSGWGVGWVNASIPFVNIAADRFTLTGDLGGSSEMAKFGQGTLELAGVVARGTDRNNHVLEGTMLLNNEPGVQVQRGRWYVGSDVIGAPNATLRLGGSDQIADDRRVVVFGSGVFDLNGNSDVIGEDLSLHIGPAGAGAVTIGPGGTLTVNASTNVYTIGTGNPTGASITGGTFALQLYGVIGTAGTRNINVNDGAAGDDLTISSAIVDGTGLQSIGISKAGFGTLVLGGSTDNTMTGDTSVNEGTLVLDKGTGAGGVRALSGRLFVGDNNPQSGYAGSDRVIWRQPHQLPDYASLVDVRTTGRVDLNGHDETIGNADAQTGLTLLRRIDPRDRLWHADRERQPHLQCR